MNFKKIWYGVIPLAWCLKRSMHSSQYRTILLHVPRHVLSGMLFASGQDLLEHCDIGVSVHGTFRSVKILRKDLSTSSRCFWLVLFLSAACFFRSSEQLATKHNPTSSFFHNVCLFDNCSDQCFFSRESARGCPSPSDHALLTCFLQALTPLLRGSAPLTTRNKRNCLSQKLGMSLQVQRLSEKQQSNAES